MHLNNFFPNTSIQAQLPQNIPFFQIALYCFFDVKFGRSLLLFTLLLLMIALCIGASRNPFMFGFWKLWIEVILPFEVFSWDQGGIGPYEGIFL